MIAYTGDTNASKTIAQIKSLGIGRCLIFRKVNLYENEPWLLDNGAFHFWLRDIPFDGDAFIDRLQMFREWATHPPDILVLPDIHRGGFESVLETAQWLPRVQAMDLGWPLYFAIQDGMDFVDLEPYTDQVRGLFLGGSDRFKAHTGEWVRWGHDRGLKVHYGRCSTPRKVKHAIETNCDSLDSAHPLWERARWDAWVQAIQGCHPQLELF